MFNKAGQIVRGSITLLLMTISTLVLTSAVIVLAIGKFLAPPGAALNFVRRVLSGIAELWASINNFLLSLSRKTRWDVEIPPALDRKGCYLVNSNHQSWVDILVLQRCFNRRLPLLRFFLKSELIRVPFLGIAWWALDFPFMKRYSKEFLEKHPHLKGKDVEITKKACEKYKKNPVAILNFVEGTRFSKEKHRKQQSPFKHLLKPKAGGIAFVLETMGEQLQNILNVTITYPKGVKGFWGFCCGEISEIRVNAEKMPVKKEMIGDYANDPDFKKQFQSWINDVWVEKDNQIDRLLN